ncbi:GNAT family N-acetyltransferase [Flavobacteriaceae bacterium R38]|nr:GNAT family N-acetyltransferase [Flavobacteriaceae bacterium R38]
MSSVIIRDIQPGDNALIAKIIKGVLDDFGVPKTRSAYADKSLNNMYEAYNIPNAHYYVAELNGVVLGGGGIAQLENYSGNVCELQKMYLSPQARGKGVGSLLLKACLEKAKSFGYEQCYLETMPDMKIAQKIYLKYGFNYIENAMGDTGHYVCPVWMIKDL